MARKIFISSIKGNLLRQLLVFCLFFPCLNSHAVTSVGVTTKSGSEIVTSIALSPSKERLLINITQPAGCFIYLSGDDPNFRNISFSLNSPGSIKYVLPDEFLTKRLDLSRGHFANVVTGNFKIPLLITQKVPSDNFVLDVKYQVYCHGSEVIDTGFILTVNGNSASLVQRDPIFSEFIFNQYKKVPYLRIWRILSISFLAGLLMNLMPCALPLLGVKLKFLIGNKKRSTFLRSTLALTFLGIVFTFCLFGIFTGFVSNLAINSIDNSSIWGTSFQNPVYIAFLISVVFLLLQTHRGNIPISFVAKDGSFDGRATVFSGLFGGIITTLLATSCLSPAIITGLMMVNGSVVDSIFYFTFIGIGFGFPYLVFIVFPEMLRRLHSSYIGSVLRESTEPFMIVTLLWLIYILNRQVGMIYALLVLCVVFIGGYILRKVISIAFKLAFVSIVVAIIMGIGGASFYSSETSEILQWEEISTDSVDQLLLEDRVILVSITADWCVTCKINQYFTFASSSFADFVIENDIVLMKGDITVDNSAASQFLRDFGSSGVPLIVLFSPKHPSGRILGQGNPFFLTPSYIIEEIQDDLGESLFVEDDDCEALDSSSAKDRVRSSKFSKLSTDKTNNQRRVVRSLASNDNMISSKKY